MPATPHDAPNGLLPTSKGDARRAPRDAPNLVFDAANCVGMNAYNAPTRLRLEAAPAYTHALNGERPVAFNELLRFIAQQLCRQAAHARQAFRARASACRYDNKGVAVKQREPLAVAQPACHKRRGEKAQHAKEGG